MTQRRPDLDITALAGPDPPLSPDLDREERLAKGIALMNQGVAQEKAAAEAGVARSTLLSAYRRLLVAAPDRKRAREDSDHRVEAHAAALTEEAFGRLAEKVHAGELDNDLKTMGIVAGIASDKLGKIRGWGEGLQAGGAIDAVLDRLESFEGELDVQLSVSVRKTPDAIDITPAQQQPEPDDEPAA